MISNENTVNSYVTQHRAVHCYVSVQIKNSRKKNRYKWEYFTYVLKLYRVQWLIFSLLENCALTILNYLNKVFYLFLYVDIYLSGWLRYSWKHDKSIGPLGLILFIKNDQMHYILEKSARKSILYTYEMILT